MGHEIVTDFSKEYQVEDKMRLMSNLLDMANHLGFYLISEDGSLSIELPNYTYRRKTLKIQLVPGMHIEHVAMRPAMTVRYVLRRIEAMPNFSKYKYRQLSPTDKKSEPDLAKLAQSYLTHLQQNNEYQLYTGAAAQRNLDRMTEKYHARELSGLGINIITTGEKKGQIKFSSDPSQDHSSVANTSDMRVVFLQINGINGIDLQPSDISKYRRKIVKQVISQFQPPSSINYDREYRQGYLWRRACLDAFLYNRSFPEKSKNRTKKDSDEQIYDIENKAIVQNFEKTYPTVFRRRIDDKYLFAARVNNQGMIILEIIEDGRVRQRQFINDVDMERLIDLKIYVNSILNRQRSSINISDHIGLPIENFSVIPLEKLMSILLS